VSYVSIRPLRSCC